MRNQRDTIPVTAAGESLPSRRLLLRTTLASIGCFALVAGTGLPAEAKMSLKAAGYQTTGKDGQNCANCALFRPPSACTLVAGDVIPAGWCRFYSKKGG